jgi:hypothetical protein
MQTFQVLPALVYGVVLLLVFLLLVWLLLLLLLAVGACQQLGVCSFSTHCDCCVNSSAAGQPPSGRTHSLHSVQPSAWWWCAVLGPASNTTMSVCAVMQSA